MTIDEALEIMNILINPHEADFTFEEEKEAYEIAIDALERQIPRKPIEPDALFYKCPICKNCVRDYNRYCTVCGYKLDWSEDKMGLKYEEEGK